MRALITRPREDSETLAQALDARGIASVIEPMLTIVPTGSVPDLSAVQAVVFTSANGVRAFAAVESRRDLPVFAVGDTSAGAARDAGFASVESAGGDVSALATLVAGRCEPGSGPLLHVAGDAVAGDLAGDLAKSGFDTRRAVLYRTEAADSLSADTRRLLAASGSDGGSDGGFDMALFFSPRTAQTFVILIKQAGLTAACRGMTAICLSPAVAEAVAGTAPDGIEWRAVRAASRPEMAALLAEIDAEAAGLRPENDVAEPLESRQADIDPVIVAEPAPRRWAGAVAWVLVGFLLVIAAAGGAYISWPVWGPGLPGWVRAGLAPVMEAGRNPALVRRVSAFETRLDKFETELAAARKSFTERSRTQALKPWAETAALDRRLGALKIEINALAAGSAKRIAALESRAAATPAPSPVAPASANTSVSANIVAALDRLRADNRRLGESVARLARRLALLTSAPRLGTSSPGAARPGGLSAAEGALLLAVGQLREALRGPHPYARELTSVRALAGRDPAVAGAVAALVPRADRGIPDIAMLRARFDGIARTIAQAAIAPHGAGWIDRILQRLSTVVTIRRVGEPAPSASGPMVQLARAEIRLAADDLAGAVAALDGLAGAPAEAAKAWRMDAAARIKADAALATLTARAIAAFGGAPAASRATGG